MRSRLPLATAAVALFLLGLAAPVAAGEARTWVVDDDGTAGATGCAGARPVSTTIQAAVDASGPGDTILVCPGRYPEQVTIAGTGHRGLTLRAVRPATVVVTPASVEAVYGYRPVLTVSSPRVTVQWLTIGARTGGTCEGYTGILVDGASDVRLQSNRIVPTGKGSTLGPCGVRFGIIVTNGSSRVRVAHNLVRDHRQSAIIVLGSSEVRVVRNSVRWWHEGSTITAGASPACVAGPAGITPDAGISFDDSTGRIRANAISGPAAASWWDQALPLAIGVESTGSILVTDNRIVQSRTGIRLQSVTGGTVARNAVAGLTALDLCVPAGEGIALSASGSVTVSDNTVTRMGTGLAAFDTVGSTFSGNSATASLDNDCLDDSGATLDLVDNAWADNAGAVSLPAGLCETP